MSAERRIRALVATVAVAALASGVALPAWAPAATATASAPVVQAMVVGREGTILSGPRAVRAATTTLRVRDRNCRVASGTALAALAALRRAGGPGFSMRDYGHCGSNASDSGQLFVYAIGGERNHGQSGWEYKVDNVGGSTGAGDPSGPRGDGRRIGAGAEVLWFWCQATASGCERTLAVSAPAQASRSGGLTVTVYGYDNEGRAVPVAGAVVSLGSDFATTGAHGHATLVAPEARGRYQLTAVRSGTVPSFPVSILVG